jgi:hypothetical protein
MDNQHRPAGKSTREMADRRRRNGLIAGLIVIAAALVLGYFALNSKSLGLGGGAFFVLLIAIRLLGDWYEGYDRRSRKREKQATRGAKAEEVVGSLLEALGPEYFVLHDIESPYGNIDHIVIGEHNGIFLIETKSHHGKVEVSEGSVSINGKPPEKNFMAQVLSNCFWLNETVAAVTEIHSHITPILVFTNAFVPFGKSLKNIRIINQRYLEGAIKQNPREGELHAHVWEMRETIARKLSEPGK